MSPEAEISKRHKEKTRFLEEKVKNLKMTQELNDTKNALEETGKTLENTQNALAKSQTKMKMKEEESKKKSASKSDEIIELKSLLNKSTEEKHRLVRDYRHMQEYLVELNCQMEKTAQVLSRFFFYKRSKLYALAPSL